MLKVVEMVHDESIVTRETTCRAVFEYIEVYYNRTRRHRANGYISLVAFETKMIALANVRCARVRSDWPKRWHENTKRHPPYKRLQTVKPMGGHICITTQGAKL